MRASTGYKTLLRYLYCREDYRPEEVNLDVEKILTELKELEEKAGGSYGFSYLGTAQSFNVQMDLTFLHQRGLVRYDPSNPHVKLTELGRAFASSLEFPDELELAVGTFWGAKAAC